MNSEGHEQLNYDVMKKNVLAEVRHPLEQPRETQVVKTYQIERNAKRYELYTFPQYKNYRLVFNKRMVDPKTFKTYPYGYFDSDQRTLLPLLLLE